MNARGEPGRGRGQCDLLYPVNSNVWCQVSVIHNNKSVIGIGANDDVSCIMLDTHDTCYDAAFIFSVHMNVIDRGYASLTQPRATLSMLSIEKVLIASQFVKANVYLSHQCVYEEENVSVRGERRIHGWKWCACACASEIWVLFLL